MSANLRHPLTMVSICHGIEPARVVATLSDADRPPGPSPADGMLSICQERGRAGSMT